MEIDDSGEDSHLLSQEEKINFYPKDDSQKITRELRNIRQSPAYMIGKHISDTYRRPLKMALLPISLPLLCFKIVRGTAVSGKDSDYNDISEIDPQPIRRNSIVFFPTNGVGFGHFTRTLAVARKLKKLDDSLEIVFFTTMPTLHPLSEEGFLTYHLPSRYKYDDMEPRIWNSLVEELLLTVFSLHRPKMFIFDGAFPYRGMLNSIKDIENMAKVWLRRGMFRQDSKPIPEETINHFDAIIRPGDSSPSEKIAEVKHNAAIIGCNPITLIDENDLAPAGELRKRLGIPASAIVCYLQLGAGRINDISNEIQFTLDALSRHSQIITVVGESILGERISFSGDSVRILRDYPNAMYFQDFDFAVLAGGYNSYHEAIQASLPTICYPNMKTGMDDQLARTKAAQESGCMIVVKNRNKSTIGAAIDRIAEDEVRNKMRIFSKAIQRKNGASQIAEWIVDNL